MRNVRRTLATEFATELGSTDRHEAGWRTFRGREKPAIPVLSGTGWYAARRQHAIKKIAAGIASTWRPRSRRHTINRAGQSAIRHETRGRPLASGVRGIRAAIFSGARWGWGSPTISGPRPEWCPGRRRCRQACDGRGDRASGDAMGDQHPLSAGLILRDDPLASLKPEPASRQRLVDGAAFSYGGGEGGVARRLPRRVQVVAGRPGKRGHLSVASSDRPFQTGRIVRPVPVFSGRAPAHDARAAVTDFLGARERRPTDGRVLLPHLLPQIDRGA